MLKVILLTFLFIDLGFASKCDFNESNLSLSNQCLSALCKPPLENITYNEIINNGIESSIDYEVPFETSQALSKFIHSEIEIYKIIYSSIVETSQETIEFNSDEAFLLNAKLLGTLFQSLDFSSLIEVKEKNGIPYLTLNKDELAKQGQNISFLKNKSSIQLEPIINLFEVILSEPKYNSLFELKPDTISVDLFLENHFQGNIEEFLKEEEEFHQKYRVLAENNSHPLLRKIFLDSALDSAADFQTLSPHLQYQRITHHQLSQIQYNLYSNKQKYSSFHYFPLKLEQPTDLSQRIKAVKEETYWKEVENLATSNCKAIIQKNLSLYPSEIEKQQFIEKLSINFNNFKSKSSNYFSQETLNLIPDNFFKQNLYFVPSKKEYLENLNHSLSTFKKNENSFQPDSLMNLSPLLKNMLTITDTDELQQEISNISLCEDMDFISIETPGHMIHEGKIQVSWTDFRPQTQGIITAHEFGHYFANLLENDKKVSSTSKVKNKHVRECLSEMRLDMLNPEQLGQIAFGFGNLGTITYSEEDASDIIATLFQQKNLGCLLLNEEDGLYTEDITKQDLKDPHANITFRTIYSHYMNHGTIPSSCNDYLKQTTPALKFQNCFESQASNE